MPEPGITSRLNRPITPGSRPITPGHRPGIAPPKATSSAAS